MKWKDAVKWAIAMFVVFIKKAFVILLIFIELGSINISKKTDFDKEDARAVLEEAYRPLEEFTGELTYYKDRGLLVPPDNTKDEEDFIGLFDGLAKEDVAQDFYEDLFVENSTGIYVDAKTYIPTIYTGETVVKKACVRERQSIIGRLVKRERKKAVELTVKLQLGADGFTDKRTEHLVMDERGKWILDHPTGTTGCRFENDLENPWSKNWKTE